MSVTTKLMVAPRHRHGTLGIRLAMEIFKIALNRGVLFDMICCHPPLRTMFLKLGYRQIDPDIVHPEYGVAHPLILVLSDRQHFKSLRSPFASLLPIDFDDHGATEFFSRRFLLPQGTIA